MVKIKCCGMTNEDDCKKAEDLGVDFVGFIFYKKSKRSVTPKTVRPIARSLGPQISKVGVFVGDTDPEIAEIMEYCELDFAQVYRPSSLPALIRVFRVSGNLTEDPPETGLCLFDSYSEGFGGSGQSFDLSVLPESRSLLKRTFIAGGIDERNVEQALRLRPFGVDLVSSLEAHPGKKDAYKMERFVKRVRSFTL